MSSEGKRVDNGEWIDGSLINNLFFKRDTKDPCFYIISTEYLGYYDCWEDLTDELEGRKKKGRRCYEYKLKGCEADGM